MHQSESLESKPLQTEFFELTTALKGIEDKLRIVAAAVWSRKASSVRRKRSMAKYLLPQLLSDATAERKSSPGVERPHANLWDDPAKRASETKQYRSVSESKLRPPSPTQCCYLAGFNKHIGMFDYQLPSIGPPNTALVMEAYDPIALCICLLLSFWFAFVRSVSAMCIGLVCHRCHLRAEVFGSRAYSVFGQPLCCWSSVQKQSLIANTLAEQVVSCSVLVEQYVRLALTWIVAGNCRRRGVQLIGTSALHWNSAKV
eukprot:3179720-Amphidinium_carterae.1